jgi:hypothetical protein
MNYCSLEDAWGCNNPSNQIKNYQNEHMTNTNNNIIQTNQPTSQPTSQPIRQATSQPTNQPTSQPIRQATSQPVSIVYTDQSDNDCEKALLHIKNCKSCYNKYRNHFRPQLIENINDMLNDNKDIIVLILIGISILLFFNLINNLTK